MYVLDLCVFLNNIKMHSTKKNLIIHFQFYKIFMRLNENKLFTFLYKILFKYFHTCQAARGKNIVTSRPNELSAKRDSTTKIQF